MKAIKTFLCMGVALAYVSFGAYAGSDDLRSKVLVVMSYDADFGWEMQIKDGIDAVLSSTCEIRYIYMNTKKDLAGGPTKAEEAYAIYTEWQPDGVIAVDDNAQSMFVVPYLRDSVDTPIVFCGVNNTISNYGYPNEHITGVTEHLNMRETIAFTKQLLPSFERIACLAKKSPSIEMMFEQLKEEEEEYRATVVGYWQAETVAEATAVARELRGKADVLFIGSVSGLRDESGEATDERESIPTIIEAFSGPTIVDTKDRVRFGALCAVVQVGEEQGSTAAEMLLQAMNGKPISEIPVTRNYYGKQIINVTAAQKFGVHLGPTLVRGVELVKSEQKG